jgi:hypothetical protein
MTGAERAEIWAGVNPPAEPDWLGPAEPEAVESTVEETVVPRSWGVALLKVLLILLALGWIGAIGWTLYQDPPRFELPAIIPLIATVSGPLILLGIVWLLLGRTSRRETERFSRSIEAMRIESKSLEAVLGIVATRLEENHAKLRGETERLMTLGDEASDRLGRVTHYLAKQSGTLDRQSAALESAAAAAKVDIGVLLLDLPRAEEVARSVAEAMKEAGLAAHERSGALEVQLSALSARGREADEILSSAADRLGAHVARIESGGTAAAASIDEAAGRMSASIDGTMARASEAIEQARAALDTQSGATMAMIEQSRAALEGHGEEAMQNYQRSADAVALRVAEAEAGVVRQREALDALLARLDEGAGRTEGKLASLSQAAAEAEATTARIAAETGPELIEALLRVREAANQAAERARDAISSVIPQSAEALGEASRDAIVTAIQASVGEQMELLAALAQRSMDAAREASERLTRQMLKLSETAASVEERADELRRAHEEAESENFSRRVALLIESLNSTSIDVTKILSNETTDSAWAAYLKGDRGVFTRRAVRLLDATEAREIARHYDEEPEFREQVNRYIHDFEAMLRRILADRDGSPLGVTILSSDMGKLYVALAQAIERIRT